MRCPPGSKGPTLRANEALALSFVLTLIHSKVLSSSTLSSGHKISEIVIMDMMYSTNNTVRQVETRRLGVFVTGEAVDKGIS
ncbi:hypothetical protein BJ165DRAFT_1435967 [Panaeolus papilionaceus]|nr:hypothetical protein BJ165DRAFT_1435967 [Panaeolus papilionaceus]